jgi:hypothetical protein
MESDHAGAPTHRGHRHVRHRPPSPTEFRYLLTDPRQFDSNPAPGWQGTECNSINLNDASSSRFSAVRRSSIRLVVTEAEAAEKPAITGSFGCCARRQRPYAIRGQRELQLELGHLFPSFGAQ